LPTVFQTRDFASAGGLMSYGGSRTETYRQIGLYTARVLKGENPSDLPVQQASKIDMIVNKSLVLQSHQHSWLALTRW
jgi:putative ABC transport system substrate-binding protein